MHVHHNNFCSESHNETVFPTLGLRAPPKLEPVVCMCSFVSEPS
jgi:hypothetical protein